MLASIELEDGLVMESNIELYVMIHEESTLHHETSFCNTAVKKKESVSIDVYSLDQTMTINESLV